MAKPSSVSGDDLPILLLPNPVSLSDAISISADGLYFGLNLVPPIRRAKLAEACMAPYIDATACEACRKITTRALISADGHRLHTIAAAKVAAVNHCQLCQLFVDHMDPDQHNLDHDMIVMKVANSNGTPYCQDEVYVENESGSKRPSDGLFIILGMYTDEGDAAGKYIPGRRLAKDPDAASNILLAKTWIELSTEYTEEAFDQPKPLPKRLIDVGYDQSPTVYLRDFSENPNCDKKQRGRYVCLSHRWDTTSSMCTTTSANLDARKDGIEISSLPQTFQDAIKITRAVGLQYIWIDSLCILQKSELDWAEEASKMGSYYGSSWLTIGAGVPSAQGLFESRQFDMDQLQYLKVDLYEPEDSALYFTDRPVNRIVGDEQSSILRTRAWTFQEDILSPRFLGFCGNQMYYRCGEFVYFESGFQEWRYTPEPDNRTQGEAPLSRDLILWGNWLSCIIVDYSSRELSYESDRLPAISGIAHERQRFQAGHYVAGLWEKDLPQALCWTKKYATGQCSKPVDYRAPSWSWAAIDGKIDPTIEYDSAVEAEIIHVSTKLKGLDPMGEVLGGILVVCGVLRRGLISTQQEKSPYRLEQSITTFDFDLLCPNTNATSESRYTFVPDTSDFLVPNTTLWFFNITPQVGLALTHLSPSHPQYSMYTFERVGLIELNDKHEITGLAANLQDEKFRTTITIV